AARWPLESLTFSPDANFLAGHVTEAVEGRFRLATFLWALRPGGRPRLLARLEMDQVGVRPVFNAAGTRLAYQAGAARCVVWDLAGQRPEHTIALPSTVRGMPAFSPDDRYLAVPCGASDNEAGSLVFWDLPRATAVAWVLQTGAS